MCAPRMTDEEQGGGGEATVASLDLSHELATLRSEANREEANPSEDSSSERELEAIRQRTFNSRRIKIPEPPKSPHHYSPIPVTVQMSTLFLAYVVVLAFRKNDSLVLRSFVIGILTVVASWITWMYPVWIRKHRQNTKSNNNNYRIILAPVFLCQLTSCLLISVWSTEAAVKKPQPQQDSTNEALIRIKDSPTGLTKLSLDPDAPSESLESTPLTAHRRAASKLGYISLENSPEKNIRVANIYQSKEQEDADIASSASDEELPKVDQESVHVHDAGREELADPLLPDQSAFSKAALCRNDSMRNSLSPPYGIIDILRQTNGKKLERTSSSELVGLKITSLQLESGPSTTKGSPPSFTKEEPSPAHQTTGKISPGSSNSAVRVIMPVSILEQSLAKQKAPSPAIKCKGMFIAEPRAGPHIEKDQSQPTSPAMITNGSEPEAVSSIEPPAEEDNPPLHKTPDSRPSPDQQIFSGSFFNTPLRTPQLRSDDGDADDLFSPRKSSAANDVSSPAHRFDISKVKNAKEIREMADRILQAKLTKNVELLSEQEISLHRAANINDWDLKVIQYQVFQILKRGKMTVFAVGGAKKPAEKKQWAVSKTAMATVKTGISLADNGRDAHPEAPPTPPPMTPEIADKPGQNPVTRHPVQEAQFVQSTAVFNSHKRPDYLPPIAPTDLNTAFKALRPVKQATKDHKRLLPLSPDNFRSLINKVFNANPAIFKDDQKGTANVQKGAGAPSPSDESWESTPSPTRSQSS